MNLFTLFIGILFCIFGIFIYSKKPFKPVVRGKFLSFSGYKWWMNNKEHAEQTKQDIETWATTPIGEKFFKVGRIFGSAIAILFGVIIIILSFLK